MQPENKRRILVIDDQEDIHRDYRKIIGPVKRVESSLAAVEEELFGNVAAEEVVESYDIDSAYQGMDAVVLVERALAEGRPYAVAFVDIRMPPGWDGIQTVGRIWEVDPEILVVLCSAYSDYSWEDIVRELGRTDRFLILRKPFDNVEVRQCAAALTERWVLARTDVLTGLLNRRSFNEQLLREWSHAVRDDRPVACVMLDLDYFKSINDRYGHAFGDQALKLVSERIKASSRPGDVVCRYGGEEFCIVMPNTSEAAAQQWAEELREAIASHRLTSGENRVQLSASCGVAAKTAATFCQDDLVLHADIALREAKVAGRNRVITFSDYSAGGSATRNLTQTTLFDGLTASDLMATPPAWLQDDMTARQAAEVLLACQDSSLPVVSACGELAGVLSEKDLIDALGAASSWNTPIAELMVDRVIQYDPSTPAQTIFEFLCRVQLRRVIIVDQNRPVGVVSRDSFLRWVRNYVSTQEVSNVGVNPRPHLLRAADALSRHANKLNSELHSEPEEMLVPIVSGVSSIQTAMSDLLTWASCSEQPASN